MIILAGVAGAGKSSQGKLLASDINYEWLSTGELLRSSDNQKVREVMLSGRLLSDEEMIEVLAEAFENHPNNNILLDGFPRTIKQVNWLIERMRQGKHIEAVVHLLADREVVIERLMARGRPDDTRETIMQRFSEYDNAITPVLEILEQENVPIVNVDGNKSIEEVHVEIMKQIEHLL